MLMPSSAWGQVVFIFVFSLLRYLVIAGIAFCIFYILLKHKKIFYKIQQRWPASGDYKREVTYSLFTFVFFALVPLVIKLPFIKPYTHIYTDIHQHSRLYFWLAFPLMLVIHDTYFYWTHRLMHHPLVFKRVHLLHHKSTNPSPWAAFAFSPAEAIVESSVIYVFVITIPVMPIQLFSFLIFMTAYNVYGHLGFELYPKNFNRTAIGKWINTSVNHNMHHQYFKGNYGLYFTVWDRVMGTLQKDYDAHFDTITSKNFSKN